MVINRNFPGQFEIQTAKNGRFMIEKSNTFRPDIAIVDIQMPGINGIAAIRELRETNTNTIFIIMTAYDRFEYAKEALSLHVFEFMNKPFNNRDIVDVLNRAIQKIEFKRKKLSDSLKIQEKMENVIPVIENGFIYSMLFADENSKEDAQNYRQLLEIEAEYGLMMLIMSGEGIKDRHMTNAVGTGVRLHQNYATVRDYIRKVWPQAIVGTVISNRIPVFLPMTEAKLEYDERIDMIEKARSLCRDLRKVTERVFRIGFGSVVTMEDGMESYKEASRALAKASGSAVHIEDLIAGPQFDAEYPAELEKKLYESLKKGDTDNCSFAASQFFEWMLTNYDQKNISVRMKILEIILNVEKEAYAIGGMKYHFCDRADYMPKIYQAEKNSDLKFWFMERVISACNNINSGTSKNENSTIEKAKKYIQANYSQDLSLDDVSRRLKLTPYYFSKLFKQETGSTFVEYLTGLRIEKAKQLLKEPEYSIKEIGVTVGYSDPNYFSRIFKKNLGVTPTEYREA